jgi:formylglycine-generating enzyme required for sulfatase activity
VNVDLGNGVSMDLVLIQPGTFTMGSDAESDPTLAHSDQGSMIEYGGSERWADEKPVHQVTIARPFYLGKTEVTREQWQAVMPKDPSMHKDPKCPVDNVRWDECKGFLERLTSIAGGGEFVLPTESQWEYACRAGTTTRWCCGDDESRLTELAWYDVNSGRGLHPVGQKAPNAWGLHDMHGNAWEWCMDAYESRYTNTPRDGSAAGSDSGDRLTTRVLRGGSVSWNAAFARSAARYHFA